MSTIRIGVFGGAFQWTDSAAALAIELGRAIAESGATMVTGATSGLPHIAGRAAIDIGGRVLGISPAKDRIEHVDRYGKPLDGCSDIIWTGGGYTARNYLNVRNCDAAIIIGGGWGTLEELCIAVYEQKIIGVLPGTGGVADGVPILLTMCPSNPAPTLCTSPDPHELVETVTERWQSLASAPPTPLSPATEGTLETAERPRGN